MDVLQGVLELLDLDQGGVGKSLQKSKGFVNSIGGSVELLDLGLIGFVVLLSDENDLIKSLSVLGLIIHEVSDFLSELASPGEEQVVKEIFVPVNIDGGILNVLF